MLAITRVCINWVKAIFNDQVQTSFSNKPYKVTVLPSLEVQMWLLACVHWLSRGTAGCGSAGRLDTEDRMLCMLVSCKSVIWVCFGSPRCYCIDLNFSITNRRMKIPHRQTQISISYLSFGAKSKESDSTEKIATERKMSNFEFLQEHLSKVSWNCSHSANLGSLESSPHAAHFGSKCETVKRYKGPSQCSDKC